MRNEKSFSVDFIIRKVKSDKTKALIYARITVHSQRREISLGTQIQTADWNSAREMVKGKTLEIKSTNEYIEQIRFRLRSIYRDFITKGERIDADDVKNVFSGKDANMTKSAKGHTLIELLEYYERIWKDKLKPGGFKNYRTTFDYIKKFAEHYFPTPDPELSLLNMQTATEFEHFVRNRPIKQHDPCQGNGLAKHIQRFKRILNWGVEIEWLTANPFERFKCPVKKNQRQKLTMDQVNTLKSKLFADPHLDYAKDLFLFSIYTGLAFVDVMALKWDSFEKKNGQVWCNIYRAKSDVLCHIPILTPAAEILKKYKLPTSQITTVFKKISNQHVNRSLQIIKLACDFPLAMTFHVARHTFAKTIALQNGVPLETIQMVMGHLKLSTTQIYAQVDEEKIYQDLKKVENVLLSTSETIGSQS